MLRLLVVWLINTVALMAVAYLMPSVTVASFTTALVAALVLGLVNVFSLISWALSALVLE